MSKVHEALKRAQEERPLTAQPKESTNGAAARPAGSGGTPDGARLAPCCSASDHVAGPTKQSELERSSVNMKRNQASPDVLTSGSASLTGLSAHDGVEHRLVASAAGRDPRTGQFLRFEDLLNNCAKPAWILDPRIVVFCQTHQQTHGAEQFRTLRSRLYQLRETSPLKKILVTSAVAAEGKTFVATNLAQAIGQERERRVLLIDADLRSPSLHLPLGAPLGPGLTEYLRGEVSDADIIQHGQTGKLCFVASGKPASNASELILNGKLEKLLDRLTPLFDWVIIDSPPCLPVADASVLAGFCDGILMVVKTRSTPSVVVERARKELQKRKILGVVMNAVEEVDSYAEYLGYENGGREKTAARI